MKLRILSHGTLRETWVYNERGEVLKGVKAVRWEASASGPTPTVTLELEGVVVDVVGDEQPTHAHVVCPICETPCVVEVAKVGRRADYEGTERRIKCLSCGKASKGELWFDTSGMN